MNSQTLDPKKVMEFFGIKKTEEKDKDSFIKKQIDKYLIMLQSFGIINDDSKSAENLKLIGQNIFYTLIMLKIFVPIKMLLSAGIFLGLKKLTGFKVRKI